MHFLSFTSTGHPSVVLETVAGEYKDNVLAILNNACRNIKRRAVFFSGDTIKGSLYLWTHRTFPTGGCTSHSWKVQKQYDLFAQVQLISDNFSNRPISYTKLFTEFRGNPTRGTERKSMVFMKGCFTDLVFPRNGTIHLGESFRKFEKAVEAIGYSISRSAKPQLVVI